MNCQNRDVERPGLDFGRGEQAQSERANARRLCGFTLVELLVSIVIVAVLIALLMTGLKAARDQANMTVCASNLQQIGVAILAYTHDYNDCLFNERDYERWLNPSNPSQQIDPNDEGAYWGVPYSTYGAKKQLFNCPAAHNTAGDDNTEGGSTAETDGPFAAGNIYNSYGFNGYAARWSGFTEATRTKLFGDNGSHSAFYRLIPPTPANTSSPSGVEWIGLPFTHLKNTDRLIMAQDAFEVMLDGNGDTFVNWYQWTPPAYPHDESYESLRHLNKANVLFADGHVGMLSRQEQSNVLYYTGQW